MPKTSTDRDAIRKVYEALISNHLGRLNAVSTQNLAEEAGLTFNSQIGPNMRAVLRGGEARLPPPDRILPEGLLCDRHLTGRLRYMASLLGEWLCLWHR